MATEVTDRTATEGTKNTKNSLSDLRVLRGEMPRVLGGKLSLPSVAQTLNVTLNRANHGGTIAVGCSQVAPLLASAKLASNAVVSLVLNRL